MAKTNPIGKNTKTIGVNMNIELADEIEKRADSIGLSTSKYMKIIVKKHIDEGKKLVLTEK